MTWTELRDKYKRERYDLVSAALKRAKYRQGEAAKILGCSMGTLRRVLESHPDLAAIVARHNPGPGRSKGA